MKKSTLTVIALLTLMGCGDEMPLLVGAQCNAVVLGDDIDQDQGRSTVNVADVCTGIYVAPGVVLTAAHCRSLGWVEASGVIRANILYVPHPEFNPEGLVNDLALMFLDGELPIDIATLGRAALGDATIQGYGFNECGIKGILREGSVNVIEVDLGAKLLTESGEDACFGDSGGPLYQGANVVAIVTSGLPGRNNGLLESCGAGGYYTQVANYANWLNSEVAHLNWAL